MSKETMFRNPVPRERWPYEAILCQTLYNLAKCIRSEQQDITKCSNLELSRVFGNEKVVEFITELSSILGCNLLPIKDLQGFAQRLCLLGTILESSEWWKRYEIVVNTMGPDCVMSIKFATFLDKNEPETIEAIKKTFGGQDV